MERENTVDRVELRTQTFVEVSEDEDIPISVLEVVKYSIQKLNNRALGPGGQNAEFLKIE
jgi:hypothetical protein